MDEQEQRRFLAALREDPAFRAEVQRELQLDQLFALPGQMADLAATVTGLTAAVISRRSAASSCARAGSACHRSLPSMKASHAIVHGRGG